MFNNLTIIGRLTKDPEARVTPGGANIAKFTVAVDNFGKDRGATFFNCTAFSKTATFVCDYLGKGRLVAVSGRIESNKGSDDKTYWEVSASDVKGLDRPTESAPKPTSESAPYNPWEDE